MSMRWLAAAACLLAFDLPPAGAADAVPDLTEVRIQSSRDGTPQPSLIWLPADVASAPRPLLVSLHSWSGDYRQDRSEWLRQAVSRDWIYLQPNFRGVNDHPEACGSLLARQDILDAVDWMIAHHPVDTSRIYLAGVSGGGHMTMLMAGRHPERFSAVSAWVGISDLADWHRFHVKDGVPQRYAQMIAAACGGAPGDSPEADAQYRERSPIHYLHRVGDLHVDLNAGVHDGKTGSVPIAHTLRAFNRIAEVNGRAPLSDALIETLWEQGRLPDQRPEELGADATYGRIIWLRRVAANTRVTIFEGGHEGLPVAACAWLATRSRMTRSGADEATD